MKDVCPHCNALWRGSKIPEHMQEFYGNHTHFNDAIAIQDFVNDRVVAWECPDCHSRFNAETWERHGVHRG